MGTAEGYVLDVYCDGDKCKRGGATHRAASQFFGESKRAAYTAARKDGWRFDVDNSGIARAYCRMENRNG